MSHHPIPNKEKLTTNLSNLRKWKLEPMIKFIQDFQEHIHKAGKHLKINFFAKIIFFLGFEFTPYSHMKYFVYKKSLITFHISLCNTDAFKTFFEAL